MDNFTIDLSADPIDMAIFEPIVAMPDEMQRRHKLLIHVISSFSEHVKKQNNIANIGIIMNHDSLGLPIDLVITLRKIGSPPSVYFMIVVDENEWARGTKLVEISELDKWCGKNIVPVLAICFKDVIVYRRSDNRRNMTKF